MSFTIKKATRQGIKPLIGLYSESGCGKTYSALLLARGFVGPSGKIALADSESGRGSLYADVIQGGYDVLEIGDPFSPGRYIEAIRAIEDSGANIGIIDSGSHEWEGLGGVLDMAGENEGKSGRPGLHNWKGPKMEHAKFMLRLLQSPLPFIVCLRAKYKSRQLKGTPEMAEDGIITRNQVGKSVILKDEFTTPIQADDFIFEMTAHGEILHDHSLRLTKCSHPALRACFPDGKPITIEHGAALARWCSAPSASAPVGVSAGEMAEARSSLSIEALKRELWQLTERIHGGDIKKLAQYLDRESITRPDETLASLSVDRLRAVVAKVKEGQNA